MPTSQVKDQIEAYITSKVPYRSLHHK